MSLENEENKAVKRETVTLKKALIQGDEKNIGEKIEVTANQKKSLIESGHI